MRWWNWLARKGREQDLDRELNSHLALEAEERQDSGLPPDEARRAAQRAFGNVTLTREDARAAWGWNWLERAVQDLRYAGRMMRRRPGFAAAAVLSLALGIGANTALFSLLNAILLRSLPVGQPNELVRLAEGTRDNFSYPIYDQLRRASRSLSVIVMTAQSERPWQIREGGERYDAFLQMVSDDYFDVLGVSALRGRVFHAAGSDTPGEFVAVISDHYWRRHYAADPSTLGARFRLRDQEFTIVGIAAPEFRGTQTDLPTDIWIPIEQALPAGSPDRLSGRWLRIMGRLRPGATAAQAEAESKSILKLPVTLPSAATGYSSLRERWSRPLLLLELVVGMVLLIACANLANLALAGAAARERELAVRRAVGASRGRLVRQLFTESLVLSAAGGALALLVARWVSAALLNFLPPAQATAALNLSFAPDLRVLGFAALLSFATCVMFGLIPALRATASHAAVVRMGVSIGGSNRNWMSRGLVLCEIAMRTLLLIVSGVFVRSLQNLRWQETGYQEDGMLVADVEFPREYAEARRDRLIEELRERAAALPEVTIAGFSHMGQLSGFGIEYHIRVPGMANKESENVPAYEQRISPEFLAAMGTARIAGRDFTDRDDARSHMVAIVNESFARRFLPGMNPLGQRFDTDGPRAGTLMEIVGVVKDSKWVNLREAAPPMYYRPYLQNAGTPVVRLAVRTAGDLNTLTAGLIQTARAVDRQIVLKNVVPFGEIVNRTLVLERLIAHVSAAFGALALLIAAVGLYGVLAYSVMRRRREIGVRIAVGASPGSVEWMVLRESLAMLGAGFVIGLPAALVVTQLVSSMLFGLSAQDPATIAGSLAALSLTTVAAAYLPARRAAKVDPMLALREE